MNHTFDDLLEEAYDLPDGLAKITLLEEAARVADLSNNIEDGFMVRSMIVEIGTFNGFPKKALVAFSWQLGQFDKNEDLFDGYDLLWSYKWILDKICNFPEISLEQINHLLEDMRQRFKNEGYSDRTYYFYHSVTSLQQGKIEEAGQFLDKFRKMDTDGMSDCSACEQNRLVEFASIAKQDQQALIDAKPILKGNMSCGEVPHVTISKVLMPLYRLNELKKAEEQQKRGYQLIKDNKDFMLHIGEHIYYLSKVDPFKGLELVERHYSQILNHENPYDNMLFFAYTAALLDTLSKETTQVNVRLPDSSPHKAAIDALTDKQGNAAVLSKLLREESLATAKLFDKRNGNRYYQTYIESL